MNFLNTIDIYKISIYTNNFYNHLKHILSLLFYLFDTYIILLKIMLKNSFKIRLNKTINRGKQNGTSN